MFGKEIAKNDLLKDIVKWDGAEGPTKEIIAKELANKYNKLHMFFEKSITAETINSPGGATEFKSPLPKYVLRDILHVIKDI